MTMNTKAAIAELGGPAPMPGGAFDLHGLGYVEEEFLLSGTAASYVLAGPRGADGRWLVNSGESRAYTTRLLVRRPMDAGRFSGTAIVEWNNVSGGVDATPDWTLLHRHLMRRGHAFVGVSAQKAGIDGGGFVEGPHLKKAFPERYSALQHPGDAWSFDIFSQAGAAVRGATGSSLIGPLVASQVIAVGESQSAMCLVTYINAVDPLAHVYDGYFVHGRGASGADLGADRLMPGSKAAGRSPISGAPERIRDDLRVPVLVLQSETDVALLGGGRAQQADGERLRQWEIAGAAHADTYLLVAGGQDAGRLSPERLAALLRPTTKLPIGATDSAINSGPQQHYVGHAALEALTRWAAGGVAPPLAPRLNGTADGRGFALDAQGHATGGLRTPWVDVPSATLSGLGQGGGVFGMLFGTTTSFKPAQLTALYPGGQQDYMKRFEAALDATIDAGFLLADDRAEMLAVALAGSHDIW
jgi:hypothetical protein